MIERCGHVWSDERAIETMIWFNSAEQMEILTSSTSMTPQQVLLCLFKINSFTIIAQDHSAGAERNVLVT